MSGAGARGAWPRPAVVLGVILVVALVARLAAVAIDDNYVPAADALDYHRHAASIAAGEGYPQAIYGPPSGGESAFRPPGYPYLLGAVYAVAGGSDGAVDALTPGAAEIDAFSSQWAAGRVADALLGTLVVLLVFLIARRIWGTRVALAAAALVAVFPPLVLLSTELLSETSFIALALGSILAMLRFREDGLLRWALLAALLAGLATLVRSNGIVLVALIAFGVWNGRSWRDGRAVGDAAVVLVVAALTLVPWSVRNAVETGHAVPLTTQLGWGMAGTYNTTSLEDSEPAPWRVPALVEPYQELFVVSGTDEPSIHSVLREQATELALENPGYVAEALFWNTLRTFYLAPGGVYSSAGRVDQRGIGLQRSWVEPAALWAALGLAMVGVVALARGPAARRGPLFMWLFPIAMIAVAVPLIGLPRYRAPADPFILMLAGVGLIHLAARFRSATFSTSAAGGQIESTVAER